MQKIIVYSSPAEANLWEFIEQYPDIVLYFIGALILLGIGMMIYEKCFNKHKW